MKLLPKEAKVVSYLNQIKIVTLGQWYSQKMIFPIENLLNSEQLAFIDKRLQPDDFIDGKTTAGWHASTVKQNTQLSGKAAYSQEIKDLIRVALEQNILFKIAAQPKTIHSMLISRYTAGMSYGSHVDNALMKSNNTYYRSDVSLTLFLSDRASYEGGELIIENIEGERSFKLEAGSALVYPSSTIHSVQEVTKGVRLVAVVWIQSLVSDPGQREILFDLDTVRRSIFQKQGKTIEFDLISKTHANLLRKWSQL